VRTPEEQRAGKKTAGDASRGMRLRTIPETYRVTSQWNRILKLVSIEDLAVFRVAQVAHGCGADTFAEELNMTVAEHRVDAAWMRAEKLVVRATIVGRPGAVGAAA
jgi:hypothetical protein